MKETFHEIQGLVGLMNNGRFEALSESRIPQNRYFKGNHLDPAAGDYEPIQRNKQRTRIEVKQHVETIVSIQNVFNMEDHNQQ